MYDGVSFTTYGSFEGLPIPMIWKLTASRRAPGTVLIGTYGGGAAALHTSGLAKFQGGKITTVNMRKEEALHAVVQIVEDRNGTIWFGTGQKVYRVHGDSAMVIPTPTNTQMVELLHASADGSLLVGFEKAIYRYNPQKEPATGSFERLSFSDPSRRFTCVVEDDDGTLWFGTNQGDVVRVHAGKITAIRQTPGMEMRAVAKDRAGTLWFASKNGLIRVPTRDFVNAQFVRYTTQNGLLANDLTTCFVDREDNLWIGSWRTGLSKLAYRNVVRFRIPNLKPDLLNRSAVADSAGHIFVISDNKLWEIWRDFGGSWNSFAHDIKHVVSGPTRAGQLIGGMSLDIAPDGKLWIAFTWGGLRSFRITHRTGSSSALTQVNVLRPGSELPHGSASGITISPDNQLWYNIREGPLALIDLATLNVRDTFKLGADISGGTSQAILFAQGDTVWVGSFAEGVSLLARRGKSFEVVRKLTAEDGLASNRVRSIVQRRNGDIWIGTRFDGISIYRNGTFRSISMRDGLMNNAVWKMIEDDQGRLWIGTSVGLQYTQPDGDRLYTHPRLSGSQVGGIGYLPASQTLWRIAADELTLFEYALGGRLHIPPLITIVGLRVNGVDKDVNSDLALSSDENYCAFRYTGLSFRDERSLRYRYRLLGLDTLWQEPTYQRVVTFASLPSGSYTFEVKALTVEGTESATPATLSFTILPPWYLSPWTIGLYIIFGSLSVFLYIKMRTRKLERRSRELEELVAVRTAEVVEQRNRLHEQAEKLRAMDALKSHFFTNISHEFRTPLTVILGHLDRLMQHSRGTKEYEVMDRNARRLLQLINQLLDLSKLEAGAMTLRAAKADIVAFAKRITALLSSYADHKRIKLTMNGAAVSETDGLPAIFAFFDHDKMEKVLYNLLSNALKFTPPGGRVDVAVSSDTEHEGNQFVEIAVSDTGSGIPPSKLPYVFDRFYQVDDPTHPGIEGTGVGLALVKELVELHRGSVRVVSDVGKGTTFTVRLPLGSSHLDEGEMVEVGEGSSLREIVAPPEVESPIAEIDEASLPPDRERILIVEDNTDLRSFLREQLQSEYVVIESTNGSDGVQKAEQFVPDIVISDIMMPEMDGYQLCSAIKQNEKTNHIPIILLTAKATTENKLEGLETGADDYLTKPFNAQELKLRVRNLIQIRKQLREKFSSEMLIRPSSVTVPSMQRQFLEKVTASIEKHLSEEDFSVEALAEEVGLSRAQLHRKLKALTNKGPNELIRSFRLQRAAELIRQGAGSLAEIAYQVGFGSQAYFTRIFGEEFGVSPSEYRRSLDKKG